MSLNVKLRELRLGRGKTLKEVGEAIGVTLNACSNYEQGIRQPSYDILKKLCVYFDVSSDYLLGLKEWPD